MAPRAYWKGWLRLDAISCPVRLYAATTKANRMAFHEVDRDTGHRIALRPHDPETGEEIPKDEIVKGYEFEKGRYLLVGEDEIEQLRVTPTKTIDIQEFVPLGDLDHAYFDKPYLLAPDGAAAEQTYRVIRAAMGETATAAIGRVVLSRVDRAVALAPREQGMVMTTLRPPIDMRAEAEILAEIGDGKLDEEMIDLAGIIIDKRAGHFDPARFEDRYQVALRRLVEAKMRGEEPELPKIRPPAKIIDLKEALRAAVKAEGGKAARAKASLRGRRGEAAAARGKQAG